MPTNRAHKIVFMSSVVIIAGGIVALISAVFVLGRTMNRSSRGRKEDLQVSRAWLADNQSRHGSD
jgi:hypothetical protein